MPHLSKRTFKQILSIVILLLTVGLFVAYLHAHSELLHQLARLPLLRLLLLLCLYCVFLASLIWIQYATLRLCHITMGIKESILLVIYSSIINFFGPLQSGPAFRAAYLKKRHNVNLKLYTLASLLYYGFFALFSATFIATYFLGIPVLMIILLVTALAPLLVTRTKLIPAQFRQLELEQIAKLAVGTMCQVAIIAVIYFFELNSLGNHAGFTPALIYSGAANFALFVSLTPGAIGFREAFILFTQHLHHIPSNQIVSASLIDRGTYILFLGMLIVVASSLHAKQYLDKRAGAS